MRVLILFVALCTLLLAGPAPALADGTHAGDAPAVHYYVSLGDSLAESFQPNLDFQHGYAEQLYAALRVQDPTLKLVKLGCGGETTLSMVDPYLPYEGRGASHFCDFPHGSQLAEAVSFLNAHRNFVRLVTIDIGANDVFQFGDGAEAVIGANLPRILADVRAAAGPAVPILGMNYYDPFVAVVWSQTHSVAAVAAEAASVAPLNNELESVYTPRVTRTQTSRAPSRSPTRRSSAAPLST
jgi:lysophospholipase L1-like esterase